MKSLATLLVGTSQLFLGPQEPSASILLGSAPSCPANPPLSCEKRDPFRTADNCCFNSPGGQFAQTQFWNSDASKGHRGYLGPKESWTIHGLWPDHCDGRYDSVCDCERSGDCSYRNWKCKNKACNRDCSSITKVLNNFGQGELLAYMNEYWKGLGGDESLHQHEWSKHGTCINSLEPKCYTDYVPAQEVVDYFRVAVDLFKTLPTYQWLADAGIVPSTSQIYKLEDIQAALKKPRGFSAVIGCQGTELREVWYFYNVRGSLQGGRFVPSEPNFSGVGGSPGKSCPQTVRYLPKYVYEPVTR